MELGRAEVAVLALPEELEGDGWQQPSQGSDGRPESLRGPHRAERPRHVRRAVVGQEDRVSAGLERAPASREQRRRIGMPIQRVHAHEDVEVPRTRHRGTRDVEVLERQVGAVRLVLLARDLDQVLDAVDADDRVALRRESEADVADPARDIEHPGRTG